MKKIAYIILAGIVLTFPSCKEADSIYKEYVVFNGLTYPAKAMDAEAHPGNKRIRIAWVNGADLKVEKARIFWNNGTDSAEVNINAGMDTIRRLIEPMDENTYSFMIRTYDDKGNVSVPVEVIGAVYGEMYERSLANRSIKSTVFDAGEGSLKIEWNDADITVTGLKLDYTDINGNNLTLPVAPTETITTLPDFKVGEPVFCTTQYKPDNLAIDIFQAAKAKVAYYANITAQMLKNYETPFIAGNRISEVLYEAADWKASVEVAANGYLYMNNGSIYDGLSMLAEAGSPYKNIVNGKLYQTVELEAGSYRFDVFFNSIHGDNTNNSELYVVAALGNDLPDVNDLGQALALNTAAVQQAATDVNRPIPSPSIEFVLSGKSIVSLGFVANIIPTRHVIFRRVELWRKF